MAVPEWPASDTSECSSWGRWSSRTNANLTIQQQKYLIYLETQTNTVIGYYEGLQTRPEYEPLKAHVERLLESSQASAQNDELSISARDRDGTFVTRRRAAAIRDAYTFVNAQDAVFSVEKASCSLFRALFETHCDSHSVVEGMFRISPDVLARLGFDTSSSGIWAVESDFVVGLDSNEIFIPDGPAGVGSLTTAAAAVRFLLEIVIPTLTGLYIPFPPPVVTVGMYHYIAVEAEGGNGSVAKARLQLYTAMRVMCAQFENLYDTAASMDPTCQPIPEGLKYVYGITTVAETWSVFCMWMGPTGHVVVPIDHINVQRPRGMQEFLSLFRTIISTGQERAAYVGHLLHRLLVAERQRRALNPPPPAEGPLRRHSSFGSSHASNSGDSDGPPPHKRSRLADGTQQQTTKDNEAATNTVATGVSELGQPSRERLGAASSRSRSDLECKVENWRRHLSPETQT